MVKGVARQVIVVKSPEPEKFEQAIFLLRENALQSGDSSEQVLKEAQRVADSYLLRTSPRGKRRRFLMPLLYTLLGSGAASALWWIFLL